MSRPDDHALLGTHEGDSPKEINDAWRKKMQKAHPDIGGNTEDAKKLNDAKDSLSKPSQTQFQPRPSEPNWEPQPNSKPRWRKHSGPAEVTPVSKHPMVSQTGRLSDNLSIQDIIDTLGMEPNFGDSEDGKTSIGWVFSYKGRMAAIWDYKGSRWSIWESTRGIAAELFPGMVENPFGKRRS